MIKICSFFCLPIEEQRIGRVLSIANSFPRNVGWVDGRVECFVPKWKDVKTYKDGQIDGEDFTNRYRELIRQRWSEVKRWMEGLSEDDELYICCWEKTGFCHRYLVAKLLRKYRPDLKIRVT